MINWRRVQFRAALLLVVKMFAVVVVFRTTVVVIFVVVVVVVLLVPGSTHTIRYCGTIHSLWNGDIIMIY